MSWFMVKLNWIGNAAIGGFLLRPWIDIDSAAAEIRRFGNAATEMMSIQVNWH